ncbi:hypothetical protein BpHYR1_046707 [Brachionus plicatilis]|uniref:Uncharacterized protein n=1 Tax=Brachionus plicatilis TaxID=10195 RepID=A0A3M7PZI6_BRAPC|nr:hypothetical protein BpHYR1_046707 [Brachionus plicatilis]
MSPGLKLKKIILINTKENQKFKWSNSLALNITLYKSMNCFLKNNLNRLNDNTPNYVTCANRVTKLNEKIRN